MDDEVRHFINIDGIARLSVDPADRICVRRVDVWEWEYWGIKEHMAMKRCETMFEYIVEVVSKTMVPPFESSIEYVEGVVVERDVGVSGATVNVKEVYPTLRWPGVVNDGDGGSDIVMDRPLDNVLVSEIVGVPPSRGGPMSVCISLRLPQKTINDIGIRLQRLARSWREFITYPAVKEGMIQHHFKEITGMKWSPFLPFRQLFGGDEDGATV